MTELKRRVLELELKVEKVLDDNIKLAVELAETKKKLADLEKNATTTDEKMEIIAAKAADELNKRWDEGMRQIVDYNPLGGF